MDTTERREAEGQQRGPAGLLSLARRDTARFSEHVSAPFGAGWKVGVTAEDPPSQPHFFVQPRTCG